MNFLRHSVDHAVMRLLEAQLSPEDSAMSGVIIENRVNFRLHDTL